MYPGARGEFGCCGGPVARQGLVEPEAVADVDGQYVERFDGRVEQPTAEFFCGTLI